MSKRKHDKTLYIGGIINKSDFDGILTELASFGFGAYSKKSDKKIDISEMLSETQRGNLCAAFVTYDSESMQETLNMLRKHNLEFRLEERWPGMNAQSIVTHLNGCDETAFSTEYIVVGSPSGLRESIVNGGDEKIAKRLNKVAWMPTAFIITMSAREAISHSQDIIRT